METSLFQEGSSHTERSIFQLNLDEQNIQTLRSSGSSAKVLGAAGIICGATIILWMIILVSTVPEPGSYYRGKYYSESYKRGAGTASVMGMIVGAFFIISGVICFRYGSRIVTALRTNDQEGLQQAFATLKGYFTFRSVMMIIVALLVFIAMIGTRI
jgi:hypothetical protein